MQQTRRKSNQDAQRITGAFPYGSTRDDMHDAVLTLRTVSTSTASVKRRSSAGSSQLGRGSSADTSLERRDETTYTKQGEKEFKTIVLPVWLGLNAAVCTELGVA